MADNLDDSFDDGLDELLVKELDQYENNDIAGTSVDYDTGQVCFLYVLIISLQTLPIIY